MKPRLLKIKGLNSFAEEQTIDFEALMEYGLFGIFGPTGSGKSSILDAITLALYGEIPRCAGKGLSGIINTDTESVYVYFEFELGTASRKKIYSVERVVKRTKTGGTSTDTAIVCDITHGQDKRVLGDRVTTTNQILRDIIGLNASDFMKSVVLPQGSFSEFLQLDGRPRREMLERIFGLEDYGDKLSAKAGVYHKRKNEEMQRLEGQLSSYEDIDRERLEELNHRKKELSGSIESLKKQYEEVQKIFEIYKDIWEQQQELDKASSEYEKMVAQTHIYTAKEEDVDRAKKAATVKPLIDRSDSLEKALKETEEKKLKLHDKFLKISQIVEKLEVKWEKARDEKEKILPDLMIEKENLKRGVGLFEDIEAQEKGKQELENRIEETSKKLKEYGKNKQKIQDTLNLASRELDSLKTEERKYIISTSRRQSIEKGYEIEGEYYRLLDENKGLDRKRKEYKEAAEKDLVEYNKVIEKLSKQQALMDDLHSKRKELDEIRPGDRNSLLDKQNYLTDFRDRLKEAEDIEDDIKRIDGKILQLLNEAQGYGREIENNRTKYFEKKALLDSIDEEIAHRQSMNMAALLAKDLEEGAPCPVCGSKDHPLPTYSMERTQNIDKLRDKRTVVEREVSNIGELVAVGEAKLQSVNDRIKEERVSLKDKKGSTSTIGTETMRRELLRLETEFQQFRTGLDAWDEDSKECNKTIEECNSILGQLQQQEVGLKATLKSHEQNKKDVEGQYQKNRLKLDKTLEVYRQIQGETDIQDFGGTIKEIRDWDKIVEDLRHKMAEETKLMEDSKTAIDKINTNISQYQVESAKLEEQKRSLDNDITKLQREVEILSGGETPLKKLKEIEDKISLINDQWSKVDRDWERKNKYKDEINREYSNILENHSLRSSQQREESQELAGILALNGFTDKETALECLLSPEEIKKLERQIKEYHAGITILQDRIRGIEEKLQGNRISQEEWDLIRNREKSSKMELETYREELLKVDIRIDNLGKKLAQKHKLLVKRQALRKELNHIEQLMSLIRGKKFVDFVAKNQLQHIARGASVRLKDITQGRYALELDTEGNFIIRDDFNGGARRPTHTLSGGETFVTSLSLALSLSSRIQMGKASLDFFFLDEGFGTLDPELLDMVISSLEQLGSNSMCVGLISHVEELKLRIPRKLIVHSAISGERGTMVTME